ncbi:family 78 glycoside hydrolase catalytic domain [Bacteroides sp.]|uniref:family 78 glycoside hydrolase catalytic domain n=1 Tax=Bacteroides sp. TaxID=29523 RepID=UPI0026366D0E|nr:family 78 glycoside hydrolase catalytic domain [Bacteroides sp.]
MRKIYFLLILYWAASMNAMTSISNLRVQGIKEPLVIEDARPLFSWQILSDLTGQEQKAYQIIVTRESDNRMVWNSGKVESGISNNIKYLGLALQPETGYSWEVTVWDVNNKAYTEASRFETGLMNPTIAAWEGAQFIGSKAISLDAASHNYFEISTKFQLQKGNKASLILGANDFRLADAFQNPDNLAGENYVRVEIDLSGVGSPQGAILNIYRVGYAKNDRADSPFISLSAANFPQTNINEIFTSENKGAEHTFSLFIENSNIYFVIDNKDVLSVPTQYHAFSSGFSVGNSNLKVRNATRFQIGPWGNTHDYNTLPNLCSVGFAAMPECEVVYTDYQIKNCGHSISNIAFDERHYAAFKEIPNTKVLGNKIVVSNPASKATIGYADPSHGALTMLRSTFNLTKKIKKAKLYATAMGAYEMFINGKRIGEDWFAPGDSQFREILGYHAYDVTNLVDNGMNCIAAQLNPAWYIGYMTFTISNFNFFGDNEALLAKLVITYEDGSKQVIVSNPNSWKAYNDGPVRYGSFFNGERYDANKETGIIGWNTTAFKDEEWKKADPIAWRDWIHFDIHARYDSPVKVRETLTAIKQMPAHSRDQYTYIYNMGVNMVGVPSISIPAGWLKAGDTVILRYAEQLYPGFKGDEKYYIDTYGSKGKNIAGRPLYETLRAALVTDFYTAKNSDAVVIQPSTTYRGYQYIQITLPSHKGALPLENIKGLVLSSDEISTGTYEATTSDGNKTAGLVNQLFKNIQRSQLGNFFTIPTDCPQRNERMGWTGDAQAYTRTATYNSDVMNFFRQWMMSLRADQGIGSATEAPGGIGSTVPTYNQTDDTNFADGTTWGAAICMVPWQLYSQYGNTQIIEENIEPMMNWLNGMDFYDFSETYPHLSDKTTGLADWLAMDERTPADLVNNAIYIYMMELTARMADAIGRADYADILRKRHALAKAEWNKAYVNPETGKTKAVDGTLIHSQSSYATPLSFNCFDAVNQPKAEAYLAELAANPSASGLGEKKFPAYTITTGFSGTPNILPALSRSGRTEQAFRMFTCTDFTSWLYPVTKGATSIWERWNGYEVAFGEKNENHMNSFNHFALGAVGQWMYEYQLGITGGEQGYKHFILQPSAGANYTSLSGSYNSNYGIIRSAWTADGRGTMLSYKATVPANTTATLFLPVTLSTDKFDSAPGVKFIRKTTHFNVAVAEYELTAGSFEFNIEEGKSVTIRN